MKKLCLIVIISITIFSAKADIKLPQLIGDHMILQRDKSIKAWGWSDAGEEITIDFNGKGYKTKGDAQGKWLIQLAPMHAGGPYKMTLQGKNQIIINDILIGDVWLCSGQSNMEFPLIIAKNADEEIKNANYPNIRLYTVEKKITLTPVDDTKGKWAACTSETVKWFSAIGYFFARDVQQKIHVPIGLINSSWGGTVVETWISNDGLKDEATFGEPALQVPQFDTAGYNLVHRKLYADWLANYKMQDAGTIGGKPLWAAPDLSTADWEHINLPIVWGFTGIPDLWEMSGIVWFRKSINLSKDDLKGDALLNLGVIQNADITYVNGVEVGRTPDIWGVNRGYKIPPGLLKEGENTIAVKVENYGGDGGFTDPARNFYLKLADKQLSLAGDWNYKIAYRIVKYDRPEKEFGPNTATTLLFNGMINPLLNFSIKGVLWYQGESNGNRAYQYRDLFQRMIINWCTKFEQGDLPFLYVQLAAYHRKAKQPWGSALAELREAQDMALGLKNTGMVTAVDIGDSSNVHPKNKQEVGRRLALVAEEKVYNLPIKGDGPRYKSFQVESNSILIHVDYAEEGLKTKGTVVGGFQIAGSDARFYWAKATIINKNTIKVYCDEVTAPVAVRYAWEDNPADANVYSSENLPLLPFRTDDWPTLTLNNKKDK